MKAYSKAGLLCGVVGFLVGGLMPVKGAPIAFEPFDYSGTGLDGQNGGTGWNGAWSGPAILSNDGVSLSFPGRPSIGGRIRDSAAGNSIRMLGTPVSFNSGTYYLSVLLSKSSSASLDLAFSDGSSDRWRMRWNSLGVISFGVLSSTAVTVGDYDPGKTWLIVMKFDATAGTDTLSIKVFGSGDKAVEPDLWDAVTTGATAITANRFKISGNAAGCQIDALSVGTEFNDVASVRVLRLMMFTSN